MSATLPNKRHAPRASDAAKVVLLAVLALGLALAAPARALAATGSVTVKARQERHEYAAYRILAADVAPDGSTSDVAFDDANPQALYQDIAGLAGQGSFQTAQDMALWLSQEAESDSSGAFVARLSRVVVADAKPSVTFQTDEPTSLESGWWLLVSDRAQPILATVGPSGLTVSEKTTPPGVSKEVSVKAASGRASWGSEASAGAGQTLSYRVTGTLPSNYAAYESFSYKIVDRPSAGVSVDAKSARVTLEHPDGSTQDVTAKAKVGLADGVLTASFADLKAAVPGAKYGDKLVLGYEARLTAAARTGLARGNANQATVEYTRSPSYDGTGSTKPVEAKAYTYQLRVLKQGKGGRALAGASFALRREGGDYLAADGGLTKDAQAAARQTNKDGVASFVCVGPGRYELVELAAPKGYKRIAGGVAVEVSDNLDERSLSATEGSSVVRVASVDAASGVVSLEVTDEPIKNGSGPLVMTGDVTRVAAILAIAASGAALLVVAVRRRRSEDGR